MQLHLKGEMAWSHYLISRQMHRPHCRWQPSIENYEQRGVFAIFNKDIVIISRPLMMPMRSGTVRLHGDLMSSTEYPVTFKHAALAIRSIDGCRKTNRIYAVANSHIAKPNLFEMATLCVFAHFVCQANFVPATVCSANPSPNVHTN